MLQTLKDVPKHKSFLFYGPPGTGKTWAYLSLAARYSLPTIVIDSDAKVGISAQKHPDASKLQELVSIWTPPTMLAEGGIGVAEVEKKNAAGRVVSSGYVPKNTRGFLDTVNFINDELPALIQEHKTQLLVLDTITAISDHLYYSILERHARSTFVIDLWGVYRQNMLEFTKGFLSFPCHRIMCAHTNVREDELTKEIHVRPSIQGSYREEIAKEFSEVWHFDGKSGKDYTIRTASSTKYIARTASGIEDRSSVEKAIENAL